MLPLIGVAALSFAVTGCVSTDKYNALKLDRDGLVEQLGSAQTEARAARAEADSYKQQLAALNAAGGNMQGLVANLQQQNMTLQQQLDELNRRYAEAIGRIGAGPALPADLDNALKGLAAQNPDLIEFDSARGIVKFKSDVTFAPGDATVRAEARDVLQRFAAILNSPQASKYDLLIAGHTDSTPVSNPETKRKGHHDNWYLSAHRAITVAEALRGHQVNPQRIGVVGYADQRPVASNASEAGKAQNRRVEVLILPTQVRTAPVATQAPARPAAGQTTATDTNPALNK
jgi:chemotaxis protein MotB